MIPMPIWVNDASKMDEHPKHRVDEPPSSSLGDSDDDDEWQFCGHSGILATMMRDFHRIWKYIKRRISSFDRLYVTGHSLGGGLAVLFALQTINHNLMPSHKSMSVAVFGCPAVISYEHDFQSLSLDAQRVLSRLHDISHCFVNRFDPIPRIPNPAEWMMTVVPYALRKIIAEQMREKMKLPKFLVPLVKSGVKTGVSKFVQYVEKYMEILQSYHPLGTYYIFAGKDCDDPFVTHNQREIEEILGFIPPHKIVASNGEELKVSHHSTTCKQRNRFSLANVTEIMDALESEMEAKSDGAAGGITAATEDEEEKLDLLQLLMRKMTNDDSTALYVAVDTADDAVMEKYRSRKLSGNGWMRVVGNHQTCEYIDLFKAKVQCKNSQYPMLIPPDVMTNDHFAAPPSVSSASTAVTRVNAHNDGGNGVQERKDGADELRAAVNASAEILKSTGKKWWNQALQAKDKYVANKDGKQEDGIPDIKRVVNPNLAQVQPVPQQSQYQFYPQQKTHYNPPYPMQGDESVPIGNTSYRIAQNSENYVVYPQPEPKQQTKQSTAQYQV